MINALIKFTNEEQWLPITEREVPNVKPYFAISNYGRIINTQTNLIRSPNLNASGYLTMSLASTLNYSIRILIHRVEMLAFNYIENHELYEVNHKDGNKLNLSLDNLEWVLHEANMQHATKNYLLNPVSAESHPQCTINSSIAENICELLDDGVSEEDIIKYLNIHKPGVVHNILYGNGWTNISYKYNFMKNCVNNWLSQEEINNIIKTLISPNSMSVDEVLAAIGYDIFNLPFIKRRKLRIAVKCINYNILQYGHF